MVDFWKNRGLVIVKYRTGFVSNSSSSSFVIYEYEFDELNSYEISAGSDACPSDEEKEIFNAIAKELDKEAPGQNQELDLIHTQIPKTWEKYFSQWDKYLNMKMPLDMSFNEIFDIIKKYNEEKKEDEN